MWIKAIRTFTVFDGSMKVFNAGETGELRNAIAQRYVDSGRAEMIGKPDPTVPESETTTGSFDPSPLDHDGDGNPGGSLPNDPPSLTGKNKTQLLAIADAEGVDVNADMTNRQIIEAIEAARETEDGPPA